MLAFIDAEGIGGVCPFVFERVDGKLLLSAASFDSDTVFANLSLALANFQMKPADIVQP